MTFLEMVDHELDQFHDDHGNQRNLKLMVDFDATDFKLPALKFEIGQPKMKKKLTAHKWVKKSKDSRSLFDEWS